MGLKKLQSSTPTDVDVNRMLKEQKDASNAYSMPAKAASMGMNPRFDVKRHLLGETRTHNASKQSLAGKKNS